MPIFARDVLGADASGFGLLMAGGGLGAVLGSLALATGFLPRFAGQGKVLSAPFWPGRSALASWPFQDPIFFRCAAVGGRNGTGNQPLRLSRRCCSIRSAEEMRGRVSGARAFAISTLAVGTFLTGYEVTLWGAPVTLLVNSSVFILITALLFGWLDKWSGTNRPAFNAVGGVPIFSAAL